MRNQIAHGVVEAGELVETVVEGGRRSYDEMGGGCTVKLLAEVMAKDRKRGDQLGLPVEGDRLSGQGVVAVELGLGRG